MNTVHTYITISTITFLSAFFACALYNNLIIIRMPCADTALTTDTLSAIHKKQIHLHYFDGDKWKTEKQELLWTRSNEKNIMQLANAWLTLLDEARIIPKKTTLQSALCSAADCAYLSFDHNILDKEETIFKKWMLLEGLLTTIALNDIAITHVQFLVQHQQLHDAHLDFSLPWPICGFSH